MLVLEELTVGVVRYCLQQALEQLRIGPCKDNLTGETQSIIAGFSDQYYAIQMAA